MVQSPASSFIYFDEPTPLQLLIEKQMFIGGGRHAHTHPLMYMYTCSCMHICPGASGEASACAAIYT
jgi:hypothetical protein